MPSPAPGPAASRLALLWSRSTALEFPSPMIVGLTAVLDALTVLECLLTRLRTPPSIRALHKAVAWLFAPAYLANRSSTDRRRKSNASMEALRSLTYSFSWR